MKRQRSKFQNAGGMWSLVPCLSIFLIGGAASAATIPVNTINVDESPPVARAGQCTLRGAVTAVQTRAAFGGCPKGDGASPGGIDIITLPNASMNAGGVILRTTLVVDQP